VIFVFPNSERFVKFFSNASFRTLLYLSFAVLMWLSILMATTSMLIAAISLTFTTICYAIAVLKKEEFSRSAWTGGKGLASSKSSSAAAANKPATVVVGGVNAV
jgi:hypothetical protein